jgi:hypothetical protein
MPDLIKKRHIFGSDLAEFMHAFGIPISYKARASNIMPRKIPTNGTYIVKFTLFT